MTWSLYILFSLFFKTIHGINTVIFNGNDTNQNKAYICPNNDDCQIICNGYQVCSGATFVCPTNYNCDIKCAPHNLTNKFACEKSIIIATYTPSLSVECLNSGCEYMIINMTYGNNLTIFGPYKGYEGIYHRSMDRISMLCEISKLYFYMYSINKYIAVYGEYLDSFSMECYLTRTCSSGRFYLTYTKLINITADHKANWIWPRSFVFSHNIVYAYNAGDIYFNCGDHGCVNNIIIAANANSLNLHCEEIYACWYIEIYCPNNGPGGGYTTNISIDIYFLNSYTFSDITIYAVEQFEDVMFNCKEGCNNVSNPGTLKCNPAYTNECQLVGNNNSIECVNSTNECSYYLLPTVSPTIDIYQPTIIPTEFPTKMPTLETTGPAIAPTELPSVAPTNVRYHSTAPTIFPTEIPTSTINPTVFPTKIPTYSVNRQNIQRTYLITSKHLPWIVILGITILFSNIICLICCIYINCKNKTAKTEAKNNDNRPIIPQTSNSSNMNAYEIVKLSDNNEGQMLDETARF